MIKEIEIKSIGYEDLIETIYFGGGTPSLLSIIEIDSLIKAVIDNFKISKKPEITLEANPDDLNVSKLKELSNSLINRLSIGIQSFNDQDLKLMNRSHNSFDSINCIDNSLKYFDNISIDFPHISTMLFCSTRYKHAEMFKIWNNAKYDEKEEYTVKLE